MCVFLILMSTAVEEAMISCNCGCHNSLSGIEGKCRCCTPTYPKSINRDTAVAKLIKAAEIELKELECREFALSCAEDGYPAVLKNMQKRLANLRSAIAAVKEDL